MPKLNWRSDEVRGFLRRLDSLALIKHWAKRGGGFRARPGTFPRARTDSNNIKHRDPVPGLPKNIYQSNYLDTLTEKDYQGLEVGPAVSLNLHPYVSRCVFLSLSRGSFKTHSL